MGLVSACNLGAMNGRWNWIRLIFRDCEWEKTCLGSEWRREEERNRGWRKRANWKRNRKEWPDLRDCGMNPLHQLLCVCLCDSGCSPNENKLIGDFASDSSTVTFPRDPRQHLTPIPCPPKREKLKDNFIVLIGFYRSDLESKCSWSPNGPWDLVFDPPLHSTPPLPFSLPFSHGVKMVH